MSESRKSFSDLQRLKIFERAAGRCWLCERKIQVGEKWEVEHRRALSMLGTNDDDNLAPAHVACHATKSKREATDRAKAKRMKIKHFGGKKRSTFACARTGKYKAKIGGGAVLR